jgi:serine/threonine protein kinase
VIDFGVARAAERMAASTSRGAVGTPAYMAPEKARDNRQAAAGSDMYSLGATLLFAATGHPPYGGAAVLDVLARLAAEEPDLSGLPAELTDLVTGCMRRDPRARLTPADLLARLGQFDETLAEEHSYLPDSAMALIAEYQRSPLLASAAQRGEEPEDATSASYTELPAAYKPPARRKPPRRDQERRDQESRDQESRDHEPGDQDTTEPERRRPRRWARVHLAWIGWVSVGAALVAGGVILGASLTSSSSPPSPPPVAPSTVCGTQVSIGKAPVICMNVSAGTEKTAFLVKGGGFVARSPVTVTMSEIGPPPAVPVVIPPTPPVTLHAGSDGTFQVPISRLYPDTLPLGKVTVDVTGTGDRTASTEFIVIPSQAGQGGPGGTGGQGNPPPAG